MTKQDDHKALYYSRDDTNTNKKNKNLAMNEFLISCL